MCSPAPSPFPVNFETQSTLEFAWLLDSQPVKTCVHCEQGFWPHAVTQLQSAGEFDPVQLCAECMETAALRWIAECDICSESMYRDPAQSTESEFQFCKSCHDSGTVTRCSICRTYCESDSDYEDTVGTFACSDCRRHRSICSDCGYWAHDDSMRDGYCESCQPEEEEDSANIRSYHAGPVNGWRVRRLDGEHSSARSYGIEIEVERSSRAGDLDSVAGDVQSYGRDLFHCESDGSLDDGFEIISQPCSLNYWAKSLRAGGATRNMLDNARRAGLLSHDTSTCGLHVHIGRAQLSRCTIYKLVAFCNANAGYILAVSRRKNEDSLQRWASPEIGCAAVTYSAGQLAKKDIYGGVSNSGRYVAVNVTRRTVEIRIFRGSLVAATVLGAIQWCDALVAWCAESTLAAVAAPASWRAFCTWAANSPAKSNRAELAYSDLYLRECASQPKQRKESAA